MLTILQAEFGPPNYDPDVNVTPLSGTPIERDSVVPDFDKYCDFLLQDDKTKPKYTEDGDRDYYPLVAMSGRPGAGKTFALKIIGHDAVKRGSVVALISFGSGSTVSDDEQRKADAAISISVRILFSLWRHVGWIKFSQFCYRHAEVPSIERVIEAVCRVGGKPTSPFVLLVDETNSGGEQFCSSVLATVGQLQQETVKRHKEGNGQPLFTIATSLRPDYVKSASTKSKRPIQLIDLPPFSSDAMRKLKDDWREKLFVKKNDSTSKDECSVFVSQVLLYTGGLPRAVQWAYQRVFFGATEFDLSKYFYDPTFDVVKMCLLGKQVMGTDSFVSDAISRFGVVLDDSGHPSLPPFQLHRWAALEREKDTEGFVAQLLMDHIPMQPPAALGGSTNVGGQRLNFGKLTVVFELVQGVLRNGVATDIRTLFGGDGAVTNLHPASATVCFTASFRDTSLQDVPSSLFERKNDHVLRLFNEGKRLVVPKNPNNVALDHANVVIFSTDDGTSRKTLWFAHHKFKRFEEDSKAMEALPASRAAVINDFKHREREAKTTETVKKYRDLLTEIDATGGEDLPKERIFVVYSKQDGLTDISKFPKNTIVVTRRGSERMLSGLGGATLMFDFGTTPPSE